MNKSAKSFSLGENFVNSPHAVSSSLPTIADVIAYEEKDQAVHDAIKGGYPRFKRHHFLDKLSHAFLKEVFPGENRKSVRFTASENDAKEFANYIASEEVISWRGAWAVCYRTDDVLEQRAHKFLQHTGVALSSREAEDLLVELGELPNLFNEDHIDSFEEARDSLKKRIARTYSLSLEQVHLARCGMNTVYALAKTLRTDEGKKWLRIGWLYVDTMHILDEFTGGKPALAVRDVLKIEEWEAVIQKQSSELAGVFVEFPTNPLVHSVDLKRLYDLCHKNDLPLVVDVSLNGLQSVNPFPYADAVTCSLTKYFGNTCDVLGGVMIFPDHSLFSNDQQARFKKHLSPLCSRSIKRLAHVACGLDVLQKNICENVNALVSFFEEHPSVKKVYWSGASQVKENYQAIGSITEPGCIISLDLAMPLKKFYDRVALAKGPSFGVLFTMLCPYMYLAHYEGVANPALLHGINPELVRISVGPEPAGDLIEIFTEALRQD